MILSGKGYDILSGGHIYVWGIGINEEVFDREFRAYFPDLKELQINGEDIICGYVQSVPTGSTWREKEIVTPETLIERNVDLCIVTPKANEEIKKWLSEHSITWITPEEFFEWLISTIVSEVKKNKVSSKKHIADTTFFEVISHIYRWKKNGYVVQSEFDDLAQKYTLEILIAYLSRYYKDNISEIIIKLPVFQKSSIDTIGIYAEKLYGGGIERVIELLSSLYINNGYKVVLITDEYNPDKEPLIYEEKSIVRWNMKTPRGGDGAKRYRELFDVVRSKAIDIMCYHFGYNRINTFYEMLYLRMKKIPVVMELHSSFATLRETPICVFKNLGRMYQIPNQVVVLSEFDKQYWEKQGCTCSYIPNPIALTDKVERKSDGKTILWVGRIVQDPKQVLDVPEIIKIVKESISDIRLIIVGNKEKEFDYNALNKKIRDNDLQSNIVIKEFQSDISDLYNQSDVVLLTSNKESFSNVIIESRNHGIPLVMYEIPWLELTKDKRGIVEVHQRDIRAAAKKIVGILSDANLKVKMGADARESAEEYKTIDIMSNWKEIFDSICS